MDYTDLVRLRKDLNSWFTSLGSTGREELKGLQDALKEAIKNSPKSVRDPALKSTVKAASEATLHANDVYSALQKAEDTSSWINKIGKEIPKHLLSIPAYLIGGKAGATALSGLILGGEKAYDFGKFLYDNPEARKAYANIFKAHGSNNVPLLKASVRTINKIAKREQPQEQQGRFEILD